VWCLSALLSQQSAAVCRFSDVAAWGSIIIVLEIFINSICQLLLSAYIKR